MPRDMDVATTSLLSGTSFQEQIQAEREAVHDGKRRYDKEVTKRGGSDLPPAERWIRYWLPHVIARINTKRRAFLTEWREKSKNMRMEEDVYLIVPSDRLALIACREMVAACYQNRNGAPFTNLTIRIGQKALAEAQMELWALDGKKDWLGRMERYKRGGGLRPAHVRAFAKTNDPEAVFDTQRAVKVGVCLLWDVVENAASGPYNAEVFELAFHHEHRPYGYGRKRKVIRMDDRVFEQIAKDHEAMARLRPIYPPMRVPPFKWTDSERGGYIELKTPLIKNSTKAQREAVRINKDKMGDFYDCLEALGSTPLRVNKAILKVVQALYAEGGGILKIPGAVDWELPPELAENASPEQLSEAKKERASIYRKNAELHGLRQFFLLVTGVAKKVQHWPELYFPPACDYRQRCYTLAMYLNVYGDDLPRGMLEFAKAVPCDSEGIRQIAIHAAGLWKHGGLDKLPFDQRVEWVGDHTDLILRSAQDPLGERWWMEAKKPLQFLAACMALREPERAAHLMWGCDGTFNGMQHYAAMSRDTACAELANLCDAEIPRVAYQMVADRVLEALREDGSPLSDKLAQIVTADTVKPPAMTTTYGVTFVGARLQCQEKLAEYFDDPKELWKASNLVAKLAIQSIGDLFAPAVRIMDYLRKIGRNVANSGKALQWETALGFPVVQPYRRKRSAIIDCRMGDTIRVVVDSDEIAIGKQTTGTPPNFVHSVDSTHLLMTARACEHAGIAFSAVHDGYKTHAQHAAKLGHLLRKEFVTLHRDIRPLDLAVSYWRGQYPGVDIPDPPPVGDFDLDRVMESRYFFS